MILLTNAPLRAYLSSVYHGTNEIPKTANKEPCIYGFSFANNTRFKIGVSSNLKGRIRDHTTLAPDFEMSFVIYFDSIEEAEEAEKIALELFSTQYDRLLLSEVFTSDKGFISNDVLSNWIHFDKVQIVKGDLELYNSKVLDVIGTILNYK